MPPSSRLTFLLGLLFDCEDGGDRFFRRFGYLSPNAQRYIPEHVTQEVKSPRVDFLRGITKELPYKCYNINRHEDVIQEDQYGVDSLRFEYRTG
jgi:hypothetical protein